MKFATDTRVSPRMNCNELRRSLQCWGVFSAGMEHFETLLIVANYTEKKTTCGVVVHHPTRSRVWAGIYQKAVCTTRCPPTSESVYSRSDLFLYLQSSVDHLLPCRVCFLKHRQNSFLSCWWEEEVDRKKKERGRDLSLHENKWILFLGSF